MIGAPCVAFLNPLRIPRNLAQDFTHYLSEPNQNQKKYLMKTTAIRKMSSKLGAELTARNNRLGWIVALALGFWAALGHAQELRYHYIGFDEVPLPAGFVFFSAEAINNSGRVCGEAIDGESFNPHVAEYQNGALTVLQPDLASFAGTVNAGGTIGGSVITDEINFYTQAALFRGTQIEFIPRLPDEITSSVIALNDSGMALVDSLDESFVETFAIYKNGHVTPVDFGPDVPIAFFLSMNNAGIISGTTFSPSLTFVGFRFDTSTRQTTLLYPIGGDPDAWALRINNRGDILGYSFITNAIERIGVWDAKGVFTPHFIEGTPQIPTVSNRLVFNDNNLIVISDISIGEPTSYIVPTPGVRLDLANLVENLPAGQNLAFIVDINNPGDMVGFGPQGGFVLMRMAR